MSAKQYVDLTGISTYDELIKDYIGDNTPNMISLTAAQYAALTPAQKMDENTYYIITDSTPVSVGNLSDLGDVTIANPTNGQVLTYENGAWKNKDAQGGTSIRLPDVSGATASTSKGIKSATLTWSDPSDVVIEGVTLAEWAGTKVVRKVGSAPTDVNDGTLIVNSTTRNQYASTGYADTSVSLGVTYYYRFFPYTVDNVVTDGTSVNVTTIKGDADVTISPSSVTLDADHLSATVTLSNATGDISGVSSSDSTKVTASLSGSTVTVECVDEDSATVTITVSIAESADYAPGTKTFSVVCSFTQIYGAEWDGTSTTAWSRTDGAVGFTDPSPAVNNGNGSSPFDSIMPWSGMRRVTDSDVGELVEIPKYYYKWTRNGTSMKLQISMTQEDGFLCSPAHADRGDGTGERDYVYVARYHCSSSDYKSTTGVAPKATITRSDARTAIHNLGSDIWQFDYAMLWTIRMLYLVEYADWNSQAKIGYGCSDSGAVQNSGLTDSMTYHTGTNAANRTTYGHVQYRYIEDLWGNVYDWCDGIYFQDTGVYGINNPASFSDSTGGTNIGNRASASNCIKAWTDPSVSGFEYAIYPSDVVSDSDYSTYVADRCFYGASGVVLYVGGYYSQGQSNGLFCMRGNGGASVSDANIGSRLQKLP